MSRQPNSQTALPDVPVAQASNVMSCHTPLAQILVVPYFTSGHDEEHAGAYEGDMLLYGC
jgi:hypothetical protein